MLKKSLIIISALLVAIIAVGIVSASQDFDENLTLDDSSDSLAINEDLNDKVPIEKTDGEIYTTTREPAGKTFSDIQNTVKKSKDGDTIELSGTYAGSGKDITINKKLTITGKKNAKLDAKKTLSKIKVNKEVTFKGITFTNFNTKSKDGAILGHDKITFINCAFTNNKGSYCIAMDDDEVSGFHDLIIKNCKFTKNNADNIITNLNGKITISNSKFLNNKGTVINTDKVQATNCDFTGNKEAIVCTSAILKNCNFKNNEYGIYMDDMDGKGSTIDKCNFSKNKFCAIQTLDNAKISNSNFIANKHALYCVEKYEYGDIFGTISFKNCLFKSNTNTAIYSYGSLIIKKCTFEKNAGRLAGAIYSCSPAKNYQSSLKISDSTFKNNRAYYAGAVKIEGTKAKISNTKFKSNKQCSIILTNTKAYGHDDIIYKHIGKLTINSKTYKNVNLNHKLRKVSIVKVTAKKVKAKYRSGKHLTVKLIGKNNKKPVTGSKITFKVFTGKKYKYYHRTTNRKGIAKLTVNFSVGKHKVVITSPFGLCNIPKTTTSVEITQ